MSELDKISFKTEPADAAPAAPQPARGRAGSAMLRLIPLAVVLSFIASAGVAWLAWDAQTRADVLRQSVGQKLADAEAQGSQGTVAVKQLQSQLADTQNRLNQVEVKLVDMQTQRIALEEMYRELARAPDDWLLAEIEQTLNIAAQQLQLAGNVRAAIMALQTADARLARADKMQTLQLRRALNQDMEKLKSLPLVDTTGISIKLDSLANLADSLPLVITSLSPSARAPERTRNASEGWATRVANDMWDEFRQLVRISEINGSEVPLLAPGQGYFLRENLRLRLLSARLALLARDEASYKDDLRQAREWLIRYFDPKAKVNTAAIATLKQLQDSSISIAVPHINDSINAVRQARAAREKPAR
jgi:uncharacterized protein HemX